MRALIQRVTQASVRITNEEHAVICHGWLVLLGVGADDEVKDAEYLANKIVNLRAFTDAAGKMNLSIKETGGQVLAVSQFTLFGDTSKGRRSSFTQAASPEKAKALYIHFVELIRSEGVSAAMGVFQAHMQVTLVNDGPVTFWLDSKQRI